MDVWSGIAPWYDWVRDGFRLPVRAGVEQEFFKARGFMTDAIEVRGDNPDPSVALAVLPTRLDFAGRCDRPMADWIPYWKGPVDISIVYDDLADAVTHTTLTVGGQSRTYDGGTMLDTDIFLPGGLATGAWVRFGIPAGGQARMILGRPAWRRG